MGNRSPAWVASARGAGKVDRGRQTNSLDLRCCARARDGAGVMPGWSKQKRKTMEGAFYTFLDRCFINSKDYGRVCLGESLYWGQRYAISQIFDALEQDIHDIYILKSRQLGISTLVRALMIFFEGMFPGLKGAIVFDTDQNKQESRAELEVMINDLPKSLKFPAIKTNNRV